MHTRAIAVCAGGLALVAAIAACNKKSPTAPAVDPKTIARIEVLGPSTVPPGGAIRFTALGTAVDGSTRDLSNESLWSSSATQIATVDATGLVSGRVGGEVTIRAAFNGRTSVKNVVITPDGTFLVRGSVVETGSGMPLINAAVELRTASGVLRSQTVGGGAFVFTGVSSGSELRITLQGYGTHEESLNLTDHALLRISLTLLVPRAIVSGQYTVSIGSTQCAPSSLPALAAELHERRYTATVLQQGAGAEVRLGGAPFVSPASVVIPGRFWGSVSATHARFDIFGPESYYYYFYTGTWPSVVERLSDGTFLVVSGDANLAVFDSGLHGRVVGSIRHRQSIPNGTVLGACVGTFGMVFHR